MSLNPHDLIGLFGGSAGAIALAREGLKTWRVRMRAAPQLAKIKDAREQIAATAARVDQLTVQHEDCEKRNDECEARAKALGSQNENQEQRLRLLEHSHERSKAIAAELEELRRQVLR